jgi:hypothetical protein
MESPPAKNDKRKSHPEDQAGGRSGMIFEGNSFLKKLRASELHFYQWLQGLTSGIFSEFKPFTPEFFGVEQRNGEDFIVLENLLTGHEYANIMDCKLGNITFAAYHSEEEKAYKLEKNKKTTSHSMGFKISGYLVKSSEGITVEKLITKEEFFGINENNVRDFFRKIASVDGNLQKEFVEEFIRQTESIKFWFERNREKVFRCSSLLYVCGKNGKCQVRQIDFPKVEESNGEVDENVLKGLTSILMIWRSLIS